MANYIDKYITPDEYEVMEKLGLPFEGFVVGRGYTFEKSNVILPPNQNGWNPQTSGTFQEDSGCILAYERCWDTSQYAIERSYMGNLEKLQQEVAKLLVTQTSDKTIVNVHGRQVAVPANNSKVDIKICDTGSNVEVAVDVMDYSNDRHYSCKYNNLQELAMYSSINLRSSLPSPAELSKSTDVEVGLEEITGITTTVADPVKAWSERVMDDRGKYKPRQMRFKSNNPDIILRNPFFNVQVPAWVMNWTRILGKGLTALGNFMTLANVALDIWNGRNVRAAARSGVWLLAYGVSFIPYIGWALALGIGIADAIWGDKFYDWVETQCSELEVWWNYVRFAL